METNLESFEYMIQHKGVFTEVILIKIRMEPDPMCKLCHLKEGILNLFLFCKKIGEFF